MSEGKAREWKLSCYREEPCNQYVWISHSSHPMKPLELSVDVIEIKAVTELEAKLADSITAEQYQAQWDRGNAAEEKVKELEQLVTRYRLTSEVYLGERDQYKAEMNELYFIFDDQLKECQCDVDYCCPMHQLDKFKEGMK